MSGHDWYRSTEWSEPTRDAFFGKLGRARGDYNRAQYLRIQADYLAKTGLLDPALELLEVLLNDYPHESQMASAHLQRGQCLVGLGRLDQAEGAFRESLDWEKKYPNSRTEVPFVFGRFAVCHGRTDLFPEVRSILESVTSGHLLFPNGRYEQNGLLAVILDHEGDSEEAKRRAVAAIQAGSEGMSGIPYHPKVGIVDESDREFWNRLATLAG